MWGFTRKNRKIEEENDSSATNLQADLDCEDAIINDKQRFGRVRTHLMKHLRSKYGDKTADRAMWRVNKRESKNIF